MDRLSDGYLVRTNESLYSVQSMANIRIRLIFDSSNTLVNRLGPSAHPFIRRHLESRTHLSEGIGTVDPTFIRRHCKGSSIIVIIFTSVHSVRWGEGVKGDRTLF